MWEEESKNRRIYESRDLPLLDIITVNMLSQRHIFTFTLQAKTFAT